VKFILCLLLAASAAAQTRAASVAVFTAPGVKHAPSAKRVSSALAWAARDLNLADRDLPNVAVFFIDRQTAKTMQIDPANEIAIVAATGHRDALRTVYQAWIIDGTTDTAAALAMIQVLNVSMKLDLSPARIASVAHRVCSRLEQEVDVASLR
jgi:hypothetical protein